MTSLLTCDMHSSDLSSNNIQIKELKNNSYQNEAVRLNNIFEKDKIDNIIENNHKSQDQENIKRDGGKPLLSFINDKVNLSVKNAIENSLNYFEKLHDRRDDYD